MAQDQRRALELLYDVGHSESLSRACYAQEADVPDPVAEGIGKLRYGLRLVAGRPVIGFEMEFHALEPFHFLYMFEESYLRDHLVEFQIGGYEQAYRHLVRAGAVVLVYVE